MNDEDFIIHLQRQNARSLVVYEPQRIQTITVPRNNFITVRGPTHHRVGYLLHSVIRRGAAIHLDQICIAKAARKRGHGRHLIELLIKRAERHGVSHIMLTCPAHLVAASFFTHVGFSQTHRKRVTPGYQRVLNDYSMIIQLAPKPGAAPRSPRSPFHGYARTTTLDALRRFSGSPADVKHPD